MTGDCIIWLNSPPGPVSGAARPVFARIGEHKRVGALADIVEKHEVVPGVASQAGHMSIFLVPSQEFETC